MLDIFAASAPGLESTLASEVSTLGIENTPSSGGVSFSGTWEDVWTANLQLRTPTRIHVRIGEFRAVHLAQLDKRARKLPWHDFLSEDGRIRVTASTRRSRIYHSGAATERLERAIADELGATIDKEGEVRVMARIEDDLCTVSVDTSGDPLYKRGYKLEVGKAPIRENLAAAFLLQCDFQQGEAFVDPMCGSGTIAIEAAQIAANLAPGSHRSFTFESLPGFDAHRWQAIRDEASPSASRDLSLWGSDRDTGAVRMSHANAARAGVETFVDFVRRPISELRPPATTGLVLTNPPYGARVGDPSKLRNLYATLGRVLRERFSGWRVGLITSEAKLAHATQLPFKVPGPPIPHGGLRVRLYRTAVLP